MRVASVCSGIGGAELAFAGLAQQAFMAEIDPFSRAVLQQRFREITLHGDFTQIRPDGPVDVLVGGTPCQSFSIAGLRRGLADERGNLALEFLRLAERCGACWVLWENVPGVLSSSGGRDFGAFLGGLVELGYGFAYRVLDAQYFGLAQRRKRVFVVGCLGDWRRAAAVLFEPASLRGDTSPSREAREAAPTLPSRSTAVGGQGTDFDCDGGLIAHTLNAKGGSGRVDGESETFVTNQLYSIMPQNSGRDYKARAVDVAQPVMGNGPTGGNQGGDYVVTHSLRADGFDASEDGTGRGTPLVAFQANESCAGQLATGIDLSPTTKSQGNDGSCRPAIAIGSLVRRLTPRECERLQGFPDDWTSITYRNKPAADGPRYRALGNAFAVPVVRWIAKRLVAENCRMLHA